MRRSPDKEPLRPDLPKDAHLNKIGPVLLGLLVLALLIAIASGSWGEPEPAEPVQHEPANPAAEESCTHFRAVASDYGAGIMTLDELRIELQVVYEETQDSEDWALSTLAESMLADVTQGDLDTLAEDVRVFDAACTVAGF